MLQFRRVILYGGKNMTKPQTVSKADLVDLVADETGMKKKDVKDVMDTMLDKISSHLDNNFKVQLTGFGTFEVRTRRARTGVKPGTTDKINIPASKYPAFKPGKNLKERVSI
jgi:DNA-binding protein HU-beta